ncbi:MAG: DUF1015 domain-containing protein [Candidatus Diapherotrites archaeon]
MKPFKAIYFDESKTGPLAKVLAPPYDMISAEQQKQLLEKSEFNAARLILAGEVGAGNGSADYTKPAKQMNEWLAGGVLAKDSAPGIYVYTQNFQMDGKKFERTGIVCLLKLEELDKGKVFGHELTHSEPKKDRFELMKTTNANLEQILCFYEQGKGSDAVERVSKRIMKKEKPFIALMDENKMQHRVWRIKKAKDLGKIQKFLKRKRVFIADGHHRYITAWEFYQQFPSSDSAYISAFLTGEKNRGLHVKPFHRVIFGLKANEKNFLHGLKKDFIVSETTAKDCIKQLAKLEKKHSFCLALPKEKLYLLSLKEKNALAKLGYSKELGEIDTAILLELVVKPLLNPPEGADHKTYTNYPTDENEAIEAVNQGKGEMAFILNPVSVKQVKKISLSREKMPPKTTCFQPKILSGLLMRRFE